MQATYDLHKSPIQPLAITFAVAVSVILGGAGGFALKSWTEAGIVSQSVPVVAVTQPALPMASRGGAQLMTRIELKDQASQAQSTVAAPAASGTQVSRTTTGGFRPQ
jgi:hypothetical protein